MHRYAYADAQSKKVYYIYIYMYIVSTLGVIPIFKVWKLRDERLRQPTSVY